MNDIMKRRSNLNDQIAEEIRNKIIEGKLAPGTRLKGEFELADEYGVSRFTIREAMGKLSSMGLVEIKQGIGTFVNEVSPESYMKPLLPMIVLSSNDISIICEVRIPLEDQAVRLFCERATEGDLEELKHIYDEMVEVLNSGDDDRYSSLDVDFHLHIAKASGNSIIYRMLDMFHDLLKNAMIEVYELPLARERSIQKHDSLVKALQERNVEIASAVMKQHIKDSIEHIDELKAKGV